MAGINVAGVKWVIRLQLVLLMILCVAVLDFLVGSFVHTDECKYSVYSYSSSMRRLRWCGFSVYCVTSGGVLVSSTYSILVFY